MTFLNLCRVAVALFCTIAYSQAGAQQSIHVADDAKPGDHFGYSVTIDGSLMLIGADKVDLEDKVDIGAAYVYALNNKGWQQQDKLTAEGGGGWRHIRWNCCPK